MSELPLINQKTFRYPALYRVVALFGALLFGFILLGSVIAEVEAIKNSRMRCRASFVRIHLRRADAGGGD